mmetsp:Transcript_56535/g.132410  ORF Transcript_56535/g.132410 Transcript_56535/m.132410 type:complete len:213 (+) Transcript_56535:157-795(+)
MHGHEVLAVGLFLDLCEGVGHDCDEEVQQHDVHDHKHEHQRDHLGVGSNVVVVELAHALEEELEEPPRRPATHALFSLLVLGRSARCSPNCVIKGGVIEAGVAETAACIVEVPLRFFKGGAAHKDGECHPEHEPDDAEAQDVDKHGLDGDDEDPHALLDREHAQQPRPQAASGNGVEEHPCVLRLDAVAPKKAFGVGVLAADDESREEAPRG